ncbi:MAG: arsenic metallochaperone ArsD family protein [Bacillota bacterium]|nr:arsenic metallochaperone ArsD family protein [Bacillota bacterium]
MKNIEIFEMGFDQSICPSVGEPDARSLKNASILTTLEFMGFFIKRHDLESSPRAFIENPYVAQLLQTSGDEAFPVILIDEELAVSGYFPDAGEWGELCGIEDFAERLIPVSVEEYTQANGGCTESEAVLTSGGCPPSGCGSCRGCSGFF